MADTNNVHVGTAPASHEARFVRIESDVSGLKGGLDGVKSEVGNLTTQMTAGFKEIGTQVAARAQPNWHLAAIIVSMFTFAVGAVWILFSTYSAHVETALKEQKDAAAKFMSREDIVALHASSKEIADLKMQIIAGKTERLSADVADLQAKIVPLSTHQELWKNQAETNKALAAMIDENRKAFADIARPAYTLQRLDKRLDDIEDRTRK